MDEQMEREAWMIMDVLPEDLPWFRQNIELSISVMRENGVGAFVSVSLVTDEELLGIHGESGIAFILDIVDDADAFFRVGFNKHGVAEIILRPPFFLNGIALPGPPVGH